MRLQEYGSCIQPWCSSLCLSRTSTWWNSSLQLVITSVGHIQWPLLFGLRRVSVYHVIAFSAHSLLDSRLSWLPCRLTFLVHPCVRVLFHGHIFFCSPPDVTVFHPYSVLWLLPTALQTRSSALTAVWWVSCLLAEPKDLLLGNERTSFSCSSWIFF